MRPAIAEKTTIVIPNYNGMKFLPICLSSIDGTVAEIILVDNASEDESLSYVRENFPSVKLVALDKNYGFSRAVNEGIKRTETEYVILLNNDIRAKEDFAIRLQEIMEGDASLFSVNPLMISMRDESLTDNAGDINTIFGWPMACHNGKSVESVRKSYRIFSSCAGASIYRRGVFDEIGLFDEKHFLYFEDVDVGWRALLFGYDNRFDSSTAVYHYGSASSGGGRSELKTFYAAQNSVYILYKNLSVVQNILHMPFLLFGFLIKILFFLLKGLGKAYLSGLMSGIKLSFGEGRKNRVKASKRSPKGRISAEIRLLFGIFVRLFA